MAHTEAFDAALKTVNAERGQNYGHPADNFRRADALRAIVNECSDPMLRQALGCITDKIARLIETPDHLDSWIDVAGYARCGCMIVDRKRGMAAGQPSDPEDMVARLREQLRKDIEKELADAEVRPGEAAAVGRDLQEPPEGAGDGAGSVLAAEGSPEGGGRLHRHSAPGVTPPFPKVEGGFRESPLRRALDQIVADDPLVL